jgi:hypothetical protein
MSALLTYVEITPQRTYWLAGVGGLELRNSETLGRGEPSFDPEMLRQ